MIISSAILFCYMGTKDRQRDRHGTVNKRISIILVVKEPNRRIVLTRPVLPLQHAQQWPSIDLCSLVSSWLIFRPCAIKFVTCTRPMSLRKERTYKCYLHFPVACLMYGPVCISSTKRHSLSVFHGNQARSYNLRKGNSLLASKPTEKCWDTVL
jgi:hypothetical protein